jgi:hypothetical protein
MQIEYQHPNDWKFFRMYANLPLPIRKSEIIAVVNGEPMTFQAVCIELRNKTKIGYEALEQMKRIIDEERAEVEQG